MTDINYYQICNITEMLKYAVFIGAAVPSLVISDRLAVVSPTVDATVSVDVTRPVVSLDSTVD